MTIYCSSVNIQMNHEYEKLLFEYLVFKNHNPVKLN